MAGGVLVDEEGVGGDEREVVRGGDAVDVASLVVILLRQHGVTTHLSVGAWWLLAWSVRSYLGVPT